MPIVNLSVPLYVHPSHFLPLLKWTAYVQSAPTIALLGLQCHNVLFILFPDLWLTCLLCCLHILSTTLMLFAYGFLLIAYGVLCNKKKKRFSWSVYKWSQYAFPKPVCNPQAISSLLFFHQTMLCLNFCKASIFYNLWAYASIVDHNFFLRHANSDGIIRMNISDMFWEWENLIMSSPGNLWIT